MKKSLLALAVLGAFAGAASAQSSVTLYGKLDLGFAKAAGSADKQVADGSSSRVGFRVGGYIGEHLRVIGRPIPTGRIPGKQRFRNRACELFRPTEGDHGFRFCRDVCRVRCRRPIGTGGFGGLGAAGESVDPDADEEEQDQADSCGGDEHGAAAASGGVHPGVLPDEIRITRQVHHGTQRQGDGGGSGCFAAHVSCSAGGIQESDRRGDGGLEYRPLLTR